MHDVQQRVAMEVEFELCVLLQGGDGLTGNGHVGKLGESSSSTHLQHRACMGKAC